MYRHESTSTPRSQAIKDFLITLSGYHLPTDEDISESILTQPAFSAPLNAKTAPILESYSHVASRYSFIAQNDNELDSASILLLTPEARQSPLVYLTRRVEGRDVRRIITPNRELVWGRGMDALQYSTFMRAIFPQTFRHAKTQS